MSWTTYRSTELVMGLAYGLLYPTFKMFPDMWQNIFEIIGGSDVELTEEIVTPISTLFIFLSIVISPTYLFASYINATVFIDVTVLHRLFVVFPAITLTAMLGQDVFPESLIMCKIMFLTDVVGGSIQGLLAPGGYKGITNRFWSHWANSPTTKFKKGLLFEAYTGMINGMMCTIWAFTILYHEKLRVMQMVVMTCLYYNWIWFVALEPNENYEKFLNFSRTWFLFVLLYTSQTQGEQLQWPVLAQTFGILLGSGSSWLAAAYNPLVSLVEYVVMAQYMVHVEDGPMYWLILWSAIQLLSSAFWLYLFYDDYNAKQQARITSTVWQDKILAVFMIGTGSCLFKAGILGTDTTGFLTTILLPFATLWFSLETKFLTHIWVGTPFHPSWWSNGEVPKYAKSDYVNMTFSLATTLITAILTSFACYAIVSAVGISYYSFDAESLWKFAAVHGITFVFASGTWMIIASSGIPYLGTSPMFRIIPPEVPPLFRCSPYNCIPIHKFDLVVGNTLMFLGGFCIYDGQYTKPQEDGFKYLVFTLWFYSICKKLYIHYIDWGYIAPVEMEKEKTK